MSFSDFFLVTLLKGIAQLKMGSEMWKVHPQNFEGKNSLGCLDLLLPFRWLQGQRFKIRKEIYTFKRNGGGGSILNTLIALTDGAVHNDNGFTVGISSIRTLL